MSLRLNISAGEFFDLVSPVVFIVSALISIWVFASARKRFRFVFALFLAIGTMFQPLIVLPLYLIVLLIKAPHIEPLRRFLIPFVYGCVVISFVAITYYRDTHTADAYLARATAAKLVENKERVIQEYRNALQIEDDAYVHKLLGVALFDAGYFNESVSEYRLAESKGDPDELIPYRLGLALERINQNEQARLAFQKFLSSGICKKVDSRCEYALSATRR